jgi:uncharacterized protein (DUF58 family)
VLVLAGAAFDSASLYFPGVALVLLGAGAWTWVELAARGARLERAPGPKTVVEGEPYPHRIRIRRGPVPLRGELVDSLLERPLAVGLGLRSQLRALVAPGRDQAGSGAAGPGRVRQVSLALIFARRGRRELGPARLLVRDPLGIHGREVRGGGGGEVIVLPRIEPVVASRGAGASASEGGPRGSEESTVGARLDLRAVDFEIDGLRPYRKGNPASRIHWPVFARRGELVERRLIAGAASGALVALDTGGAPDEDALDAAVRAAASLAYHLARTGGCALLLPGEARPHAIDAQLRGWPLAHARLAVVAGNGAPALARGTCTGALFLVSALPAEAARALAARLGAPAAWLVTPEPLRGIAVSFTVAGCHGQALGGGRRAAWAREAG